VYLFPVTMSDRPDRRRYKAYESSFSRGGLYDTDVATFRATPPMLLCEDGRLGMNVSGTIIPIVSQYSPVYERRLILDPFGNFQEVLVRIR